MQTGPNTSSLIDGWLESDRGSHPALITAEDVPWLAVESYRSV